MIETYKVLGAGLTISEFTMADLSEYSRVKENTVRTVINRYQDYFEEIYQKQTGRQGGQPKVFRLKEEKINDLQNRIKDLFNQLKPNIGVSPEPPHSPSISLGLLIAKDILEKIVPNKEKDKKKELIELAKTNLYNAEFEYSTACNSMTELQHREYQAYVITIKGLITLMEAELVFEENHKRPPQIDFSELYRDLANSTQIMWNLGRHNQEFAFNAMQRTANSPLIHQVLQF